MVMAPGAADPSEPPRLAPADAVAIPTWRAAYSDRTAALMAAFCQLAYVPFVDDQPPPGRNQPKQEKAGGRAKLEACLADGRFRLAAVFNKDDVQAFLAVNEDQLAVLAFRGTANFRDWMIDLDAFRIPLPGFPGVEVHEGFWGAFEASRDDIMVAVEAHVPDNLGLYITGHSLGGALAQIASAVLERDNLAACYTYGSPRVGTRNFDVEVKCPHYRLVNHWDLVPGVPWPVPWGYAHSGDPRLLAGPAPKAVLRRDHGPLARFLVDLWALLRSPFVRRFTAVDDHMIWNYRTQLQAIAKARSPAARAARGGPGIS